MTCAGCLASLQPPINADFRYRLNELVARALDQGAISVTLTLLFLESLSQSFMYVPGFELRKTKPLDVDIIGSCDGHLFLAECKDLRDGASPATIRSVISQLTTLIDIASDIGAEMVFLSLLIDVVPAILQTKLAALKKNHESMALHILTMTDLEKGNRTLAATQLPVPTAQVNETPLTLSDFLPTQRYKRKGWIRKPGDRAISF